MDRAIYHETGVIHRADNLDALQELPDNHVDLIYLDPPFFSNRRYEVIWGDEAEVRSFEDRWKGGLREYTDWMRKRMMEMHRVLKDTGSLYLHCDPSASHYLKVMLDELFSSPGGFRSEIIWKRSSAHSDTKQGRRQHGRIHDVIFFYTKGEEWTWNPVYTPYDPEYVGAFYKHVESGTGRRYRLGDLTGPGGAAKGNPEYEVMGVTRYWRYSKDKMEKLVEEGRVVQVKPGAVPAYKRYLDEMPGVPLQDVWTDIRPLASRGKERMGYPTQKPEALIERILASSTNRGDIVLDPFCGCGTTIAVAQQMQRRWIGIDISPQAAAIMKRRVDGFGANAVVTGLPETIEDLRALGHYEFQNWVIDEVNGVRRVKKTKDLGIDGYSYLERCPIQVKQQDGVGRKAVDEFETAMQRDSKDVGYIVAFSFTEGSDGAYAEAARSRQVGKTSVHLVTVEKLLEVKDLVLAARAERREPDVSHIVTPDLMGFFAGALKERRLTYKRPPTSFTELVNSAGKHKPRQLRIVGKPS
jgi:DNA modification methylase